MALYMYTPGNRSTMQAETIKLIGKTPEDIESERQALIEAGMVAVSRGKAHEKEITGQLAKADPARLPAELMSRVLDPDYYDAPVMSSTSGLAVHAPGKEGSPNFALLSEEVKDAEELITEGGMDRETFTRLVVSKAITHDALQYEPYVSDDQLKLRAHNSFGYMVNNLYLPVVTVLNSEHPLPQLIEQSRQA